MVSNSGKFVILHRINWHNTNGTATESDSASLVLSLCPQRNTELISMLNHCNVDGTMRDSTNGSFMTKPPQIFTAKTIMTKYVETSALPNIMMN